MQTCFQDDGADRHPLNDDSINPCFDGLKNSYNTFWKENSDASVLIFVLYRCSLVSAHGTRFSFVWKSEKSIFSALSALHRLAADKIMMLKVTGAGGAIVNFLPENDIGDPVPYCSE